MISLSNRFKSNKCFLDSTKYYNFCLKSFSSSCRKNCEKYRKSRKSPKCTSTLLVVTFGYFLSNTWMKISVTLGYGQHRLSKLKMAMTIKIS